MDDTDWIFELLYDLAGASDAAGMRRLCKLLNLCMDVYIEEEALVQEASMMFRSTRAAEARNKIRKVRLATRGGRAPNAGPLPDAPPNWLNILERQVEATLVPHEGIAKKRHRHRKIYRRIS